MTRQNGIVETELAIEALEEYQILLHEGLEIVKARADQFSYLRDPRFQRVESDLNSRVLLVERIFEECDEILAIQFKSHPRAGWTRASEIEPIEMLLGLLRSRDREEAIFGEKGPRLAAANLHPWIWNSAVSLWDSGHYADAVNRASTDLFDVHLPQKLGIAKVGGIDDRITKAFSSNPPTSAEPRLRFPGVAPGVRTGPTLTKVRCTSARDARKEFETLRHTGANLMSNSHWRHSLP